MGKPRIAVCKNNHVYDSSLYTECPICQKRMSLGRKAAIKATPENNGRGSSMSEEATVHLFDDTADVEPVSSHSFRGGKSHGRSGSISVGTSFHTSQGTSDGIAHGGSCSGSGSSASRRRRLTGWLVFLTGKDYGMSLQLLEGQNFISLDENGYAKVTREPQHKLDCFASITVTSDNRFLASPFRMSKILINHKPAAGNQEILVHQVLQYRNCEMMFIPFTGVHFNWT